MTQQSNPTAADFSSRIEVARARWNSLKDRATLSELSKEMESFSTEISSLEANIRALRKRGYVYGHDWEQKAAQLARQWPAERSEANKLMQEQITLLNNTGREIKFHLDYISQNPSQIVGIESDLQSYEQQLYGAMSRVRSAYAGSQDSASDLSQAMIQAAFLLDHLDKVTFKLFPNENGVAACKAEWVDKEDTPEGILFLTNHRLLFEQKEEKAAQKVLFITTKKELIQAKLWEAPIGALLEVNTEDKGGFMGIGKKQLLYLTFDPTARDVPSKVTMHVKDGATNEAWGDLINRVKSGAIAGDVYNPARPSAAPAGAAAAPTPVPSPALVPTPAAPPPTICPSCGAKLPTFFKGMQQVTCEYCSQVVAVN